MSAVTTLPPFNQEPSSSLPPISPSPHSPPLPLHTQRQWLELILSWWGGKGEGLECPPTPRSRDSGRSSLVVSQQQQRVERDQHSSTANTGAGAGAGAGAEDAGWIFGPIPGCTPCL